jgi:hypothetical protein
MVNPQSATSELLALQKICVHQCPSVVSAAEGENVIAGGIQPCHHSRPEL